MSFKDITKPQDTSTPKNWKGERIVLTRAQKRRMKKQNELLKRIKKRSRSAR